MPLTCVHDALDSDTTGILASMRSNAFGLKVTRSARASKARCFSPAKTSSRGCTPLAVANQSIHLGELPPERFHFRVQRLELRL